MKKVYPLVIIAFLFFFQTDLSAQQKLFAGRVLGFSTQYDVYPYGWAAYQILGIPNVYPVYGDIEEAYNPLEFGVQRDYIELGFDNNGPIDSIFIYETYTPGFVDSVFVRNPGTQNWDLVYSDTAAPAGGTARILAIGFPMTSYNVNEIRLTLANDTAPDWVEIDAVAISPATTNTFTPEPLPGNSYNFDGVNDEFHTYCSLLNLFTADGATMTAWINIHQNNAPSPVDVFDGAGVLCDADGTYMGVYLTNMGGNDSLYFYNYDGNDTYFGMDYTLDTWMHIAWVHQDGFLSAYKNGVLYRSIPSSSTTYLGMRALEIGYNLNSGQYFEGEIDEVLTFNRGLDDTEIWNVMHMSIPGNMPGMTGYWQMSDCDSSHHYNPKNHIADSLNGVTCTVSGVPDFIGFDTYETGKINMYPNPSNGMVNIQLTGLTASHVFVYDLMGRMVFQQNIPGETLLTMDLNGLSSGVYSIQVIGANQKTYTSRLILQ